MTKDQYPKIATEHGGENEELFISINIARCGWLLHNSPRHQEFLFELKQHPQQPVYILINVVKEFKKMAKCPVCGMMVDERTAPSSEYKGKTYYFMNPTHKSMFDNDPEKFLRISSKQDDNMSMGKA